MKTGRKRKLSLLLVLLFLFSPLLSGCAREMPEETEAPLRKMDFDIPDPVTLRVLLDTKDEYAKQAEALAGQFMAAYENVTVEIETLPNTSTLSGNWREMRKQELTKINKEIANGEGPDLFLLNAATLLEDRLFPDMNVAMREGCFADLNEYYMTDGELNRENLTDGVMEAGMVDNSRYLLPLGYTCRVAYVDMERLHEAGLDNGIFDSGINNLLEAVCRLGDSDVADALSVGIDVPMYLLEYFPDMLDYDSNEVGLTVEQLTAFLTQYQQYISLCSGNYPNLGKPKHYVTAEHWHQQGYCMNVGTLGAALEEVTAAKALGFDLQMFPITGTDGRLTASIGIVGAVGSNCGYPEVAYEFLRMFLLPETQTASELMVGSAPVRTRDAVSTWFRNYHGDMLSEVDILIAGMGKEGIVSEEESKAFQQRREVLDGIEVTDFDIPILQNTIEVAQIMPWELKAELSAVINQLNDPATGEPTDVDIGQLAQGYIDFLNNYLHGQLGAE